MARGSRKSSPRNTAANKDFWRLVLDDGDRTEIPVFSHAQKGRVTRDGDTLTWQTEGGVSCRFSPYLYSLMTRDPCAEPREPEPPK